MIRFVCRKCGAYIAETGRADGAVELELRAFGLESEDSEAWLRPDGNDGVVVVRTACDRCLAAGYEDTPIWYN